MKTSSYEESFDDTQESVEDQYENYDEAVFTKCVNYDQNIPEEIFTRCVNYEHNVSAPSLSESADRSEASSVRYESDDITEPAIWQPEVNEENVEAVNLQQELTEQSIQSVTVQEMYDQIQTGTPQQEICERLVKIEASHQEYTPNAPPPVPKRTLLPAEATKSKVVATKQEPESEAVSQYVTPISTVASTPQHEKSLAENVEGQNVSYRDIDPVSPDFVPKAERWSDSTSVSLPGQIEDVETVSSDPGNIQGDAVSEMYYTASSEVSLLSDTDQDKVHDEEDRDKDDRKNVIAGHVAAMRERFESMTRANTPCPDLVRSLSPSLEVFRNISPSPDRMS